MYGEQVGSGPLVNNGPDSGDGGPHNATISTVYDPGRERERV